MPCGHADWERVEYGIASPPPHWRLTLRVMATRPYTVGRVVDCFVGLSRHLPQEGGFAEMPVERSGKLVCLAFGNVAAYTLQDL